MFQLISARDFEMSVAHGTNAYLTTGKVETAQRTLRAGSESQFPDVNTVVERCFSSDVALRGQLPLLSGSRESKRRFRGESGLLWMEEWNDCVRDATRPFVTLQTESPTFNSRPASSDCSDSQEKSSAIWQEVGYSRTSYSRTPPYSHIKQLWRFKVGKYGPLLGFLILRFVEMVW